ncbi:hypothetical protein [Pseudarthrobacter sp. MM222]|uniref:hypothetical protein n=1 Tax=Pseudarthrobacter sp. MM222 TaxID=3018929 RepID=UPI00221F777F|nr:hypothetical protein [Pseudarthrobacter sp. MM222]CAI3800414.1 hypothetical protein NKCBBBOE_02580 [Pseudarthrobacter sp. MM222]
MTPSPFPAPAASVQAAWWEVLAALGPLAVVVAAVIGAAISWRTLRQRTIADANALLQKSDADDRSEWWKRTQWALDHALRDDQHSKSLGLATLAVLAQSGLARDEELELLDLAWQSVEDAGRNRAYAPSARPASGAGEQAADRRLQVAAARLRVALDGRLGRGTPPEAAALAKESF